uniref:MIF4G domain-containing protein n=1 Tax=Panagrolaimus davidi TaxID=227884 RepID=A0A914PC26_9BILA
MQSSPQTSTNELQQNVHSSFEQNKIKVHVKLFVIDDKEFSNVSELIQLEKQISLEDFIPNIFQKFQFSADDYCVKSTLLFNKNTNEFDTVTDKYILQPFDKFAVYLAKMFSQSKTKVTVSQIGKEQQNTWIGSSQITNIKELSKLLSDKMELEDGNIFIKKFDEDFGENISVKDDEKFDPTKIYNIQITKTVKFNVVVEPDLTYLNEQPPDFNVENKGTNVEKVSDIPFIPVSSKSELAPSITTSGYSAHNFRKLIDKRSPATFESIHEKITEIPYNQISQILATMAEILFKKAVNDHTFAEMCADLCKIIHRIEMKNEGVEVKHVFYSEIIRKCQSSFESRALLDRQISAAEIQKQLEEEKKNETKFAVLNENKKQRMIGIIKFISHLHRVKLLAYKIIENCIVILIRNYEDYDNEKELMLEYAITFMENVGPILFQGKEDKLNLTKLDGYVSYLDKFKDIVSNRIKFMIDNLIKLRDQKWIGVEDSAVADSAASDTKKKNALFEIL